MKKQILYFCLLMTGTIMFAQNFNENGELIDFQNLYYDISLTSDLKFTNNSIIIRDYDKGNPAAKYIVLQEKVSLERVNKFPFLELSNKEKYLILANEDLFILYEKNNSSPKFLATNFGNQSEFIEFINPNTVKASSELVEGKIVYKGDNISNLKLSSPWVEGINGNGIGEYIEFLGNCSYLYFLNGYISFDKPYLYEANSRLKKIEISFPNEKERSSIIIDLKDTPNPQKVNLGFRCNSEIRIKILDVYEGNKYKDTCLSGIIMKVY